MGEGQNTQKHRTFFDISERYQSTEYHILAMEGGNITRIDVYVDWLTSLGN